MEVAMKRFVKEQGDVIERKLDKYCKNLLNEAVQFRFSAPGAHNFTGNLVGSIVAGLFRDGNLIVYYISGEGNNVDRVRKKKMTYPKRYFFKEDYDTVPHTVYKPEVVTDSGFGRDDAKRFIESYMPSKNSLFEVVVAYTTEYASFVETERHTTGYLNTVNFIKMTAVKAVQ